MAIVAIVLCCAWLTPGRAAGTTAVAGSDTGPSVPVAHNGAPQSIPGLANWTPRKSAPYKFSRATALVATGAAADVAHRAATDLQAVLGFEVASRPGRPSAHDIALRLDPRASNLGAEGYTITVGDGIAITAHTTTGLYWAREPSCSGPPWRTPPGRSPPDPQPTYPPTPSAATTCDASRNLQRWWLRKVPGGYTITNAIVLLPLHVDGTSVTQQLPDETPATVWRLTNAGQ